MRRCFKVESSDDGRPRRQIHNGGGQNCCGCQNHSTAGQQFRHCNRSLTTRTVAIVARSLRRSVAAGWSLRVLVARRLAIGLVDGSGRFCGVRKTGASTLEVSNQTESDKQDDAFHTISIENDENNTAGFHRRLTILKTF